MHAVVLGCGVSGLSTAIRFLEADSRNSAEIWARDLPPDTTSNIAAAIWYPYRALPFDRVLGWGARTLDLFYELADDPASGVTIRETIELFREPPQEPWWRSSVRKFSYVTNDECSIAFAGGYRFESAVIETSIYLPYLMSRFRSLGGTIVRREVASLDEAFGAAPLVFNCTGLGSLKLLNDKEMFPIRGQIIRATKPDFTTCYLDDKEDNMGAIAYIVPRSNDCILGGTAHLRPRSVDPDPKVAQRIMNRCAILMPDIVDVTVLEHKVGLRPGRSSVRLEREHPAEGRTVVHNYGHGGAGITLSWGCAEEAVALALAG